MAFTGSYNIRKIPNLRTGLHNGDDPEEIFDTDMADAENVEVDTRIIRNAAGYVGYDDGSTSGPFWGGFHARFEDGTNKLVRQRKTTLEYDNGSGTWTECTLPTSGSPATTVVLTEEPCSFEMLNDTILWSNGTDVVMSSTDGITWSLQASLPKSKKLFNNGLNRILFMAQPAAPSRIDWSDINTPTTIDAASFQFIGKNDGEDIEDAVLLPSGGMIVFKTNRFYQISDITMGLVAVDPIGEAPCVRGTAVATENSAVWAGPDARIYEFSGGVARVISNHITPLNITKPVTMQAVYHNQRYRLAVPNGSDNYNSYEYVADRQLLTGIPTNPYVITKNQRYIGCYIREDREVSGVRRSRLYFGDSRNVAEGSPAAVPGVFAYINDIHDSGVTQGLDGTAQTCTFTTKFYTEDNVQFLKRYVKYFLHILSTETITFTVSYRFDPNETFIEFQEETSGSTLDMIYDDLDEGGFSEGYSFTYTSTDEVWADLEKAEREPRGIQLKITWSSTQDAKILDQSYKFLTKNNFVTST